MESYTDISCAHRSQKIKVKMSVFFPSVFSLFATVTTAILGELELQSSPTYRHMEGYQMFVSIGGPKSTKKKHLFTNFIYKNQTTHMKSISEEL